MPTDPNDDSFELRSAALLSARLSGGVPTTAPETPARTYVSFSAARLCFGTPARAPREGAPESEAVELPWSDEMMGSEGWSRMLDWCVSAHEAEGAFVVDGRGLMIGSCGMLGSAELEEIGARLLLVLEQADLMSAALGDAQSASIEMDSGWLTGLRVPIGEADRLVVGMVTAQPLPSGARRAISAAFTKKALGV